jgi:hypothetical protein
MSELIAEAVERLRREKFLTEVNEAYRRAGPDPEQAIWDGTLMDGLEGEPPYEWPTPRRAAARSGKSTSTQSAGTNKDERGPLSSSPRTSSTKARRGSSSSAR